MKEKEFLKAAFDEQGNPASPVMSAEHKNFLIDIDGTICDDVPNEQPDRMVTAVPFDDALQTINKWFDEGHIIYFFSSRTESLRDITETWLRTHGFKYHGIISVNHAGAIITGSITTSYVRHVISANSENW
jgi:uncharacterized HAD superfamily protein